MSSSSALLCVILPDHLIKRRTGWQPKQLVLVNTYFGNLVCLSFLSVLLFLLHLLSLSLSLKHTHRLQVRREILNMWDMWHDLLALADDGSQSLWWEMCLSDAQSFSAISHWSTYKLISTQRGEGNRVLLVSWSQDNGNHQNKRKGQVQTLKIVWIYWAWHSFTGLKTPTSKHWTSTKKPYILQHGGPYKNY